jgi:hypothetical protein
MEVEMARFDQQRVNGEKPTLHLFNGGQGVSQGPSPNSGQAIQSHENGAQVPSVPEGNLAALARAVSTALSA